MSAARDMTRYNADRDRIREALVNWLDAGVTLYLLLRDVEREGNWKLGGHANFGEFLSAEFPNNIGTHRYKSVIGAIEIYGEDFVRLVGAEGAHAIISNSKVLGDKTRRDAVVADVLELKKKNGSPPGVTELRRLVQHHAGETQHSNAADAASRSRKEAETLTELRGEIRALNQRIRAITKERDAFKAKAETAEKYLKESKARCVDLSKQVAQSKRGKSSKR